MFPALPDGSTILVDYQRRTLWGGYIYLFRSNDSLLVKRARRENRERFSWHSDNPAWKPIEHSPDFQVWGQVHWAARIFLSLVELPPHVLPSEAEARLRQQVLKRDEYSCQLCGACPGDPDDLNPGRHI